MTRRQRQPALKIAADLHERAVQGDKDCIPELLQIIRFSAMEILRLECEYADLKAELQTHEDKQLVRSARKLLEKGLAARMERRAPARTG